MKFFKNLSKNFKKWKPVHTIICVLLILILSCATFCPHSCVFLPGVLNFRENFADRLTDINADEKKRQKALFVMFYAPWCGYCKKAKPEWERTMRNNKSLMSMIDCTTDDVGTTTASTHNVTSFPTIRWFRNGIENVKNFVEYTGERTASGFQDFINKQTKN